MIGAILAAGELILGATQAIAKNRAQAAQKRANDNAANDAFSETSRQLAMRQEQEALSTAQQVHQLSMEGDAQQGSLDANAASAGVDGNTVDALHAELLNNEYNARDVLDRNLAMTDANLAEQRRAAGIQRDSRIAGAQGPSDLATGLEIGGSLATFGYDWLKLHPKEQ